MGFISKIKASIKEKSKQNAEIRKIMADAEMEERRKQAVIVAKARVKAKAKQKIASYYPSKKPAYKRTGENRLVAAASMKPLNTPSTKPKVIIKKKVPIKPKRYDSFTGRWI